MKKIRLAFVLNLILFICETIGLSLMFFGIGNAKDAALTANRIEALRYFTVDSNVIVWIFSLFVSIDLIITMIKKKSDISVVSYVLTLVGCVGVTLTMLVTVFFLEPTLGPKVGWFSLFSGSNFFLHLVNPILSIVTFMVFMRTKKIKMIHTLTGIAPMLIYSIYYTVAALTHIEGNKIAEGYDWYGFLAGGVGFAFLVIPLLLILTYGISFGLWKLNRINGKAK